MASDFATLVDLKKHWPALPAEKEVEASQKLQEASIEIRALYPNIDSRISEGLLEAEAVKLVVCRMVKRAMDNISRGGVDGVESVQEHAGPWSQTLNFSNPDGNLYLSKSDKRILAAGRERARAWTIHPGGLQ